ncbi:hypothetical protein MCUN1_003594 [Malassezia cuniculi]|uniref:tRNA-splicing endonuclease subunit Sen15 domain-containing protein n=1 Tax=Malassezia cuniculi TaxID=948313 RepID=A0AAF0EXU5_9BASI|nr:hypothetical protein MCUN1_003594 [Malassezia cuniculi]
MSGAPSQNSSGAVRAEDHPVYPRVREICAKYPMQAGPLFQTFVDLQFGARWRELEVFDVPKQSPQDTGRLGSAGLAFIRGIPKDTKEPVAVLPIELDDTLNASLYVANALLTRIRDVFSSAGASQVLLAMMSSDATVVYYRLSQGMVKPIN